MLPEKNRTWHRSRAAGDLQIRPSFRAIVVAGTIGKKKIYLAAKVNAE